MEHEPEVGKDSGKKSAKGREVNVADLEEGDDDSTKEIKKRIKRTEPDGEFIPIQLGDDPLKTVKIGAYLPDEVKENLTRRLKEHARSGLSPPHCGSKGPMCRPT